MRVIAKVTLDKKFRMKEQEQITMQEETYIFELVLYVVMPEMSYYRVGE
jgi:hypothetical protein